MRRALSTLDILVLLGVFVGVFAVLYPKFLAFLTPPAPAPQEETAAAPSPVNFNTPLAPDEPHQYSIATPRTFEFKGYQLRELAEFKITGVLLSRRTYSSDSQEHRSVLAPSDFGLGWGPMSTPSILKNFSYFQKDRFLYYTTYASFSQEANRLNTDAHLANIHLIPANENIASVLPSIKPRDLVTLEGSLVEVYQQNQRIWKSSLSRSDMGDGACEVMFVRRIEWYAHPKGSEIIPLPQSPPPDTPLP